MSDVNVPLPPGRRYESVSLRGFTLLELLVAMAVFGITLGMAMPHSTRDTLALWDANQQLLADLRRTRGDALIQGDHFRLDVSGASEYKEYRMRLVGAEWLPQEPPVRSRTLPTGVTFTAGVGKQLEFNTRGLLVDPNTAGAVELTDSRSGKTRRTTIWPSGQVIGL